MVFTTIALDNLATGRNNSVSQLCGYWRTLETNLTNTVVDFTGSYYLYIDISISYLHVSSCVIWFQLRTRRRRWRGPEKTVEGLMI